MIVTVSACRMPRTLYLLLTQLPKMGIPFIFQMMTMSLREFACLTQGHEISI